MSLPLRQQAILDRMDRALRATDPQLHSTYAAFARRAGGASFPTAEVISTRPVRYLVLALVILLATGLVALGITSTGGGCAAPAWHATCTTTPASPNGS